MAMEFGKVGNANSAPCLWYGRDNILYATLDYSAAEPIVQALKDAKMSPENVLYLPPSCVEGIEVEQSNPRIGRATMRIPSSAR